MYRFNRESFKPNIRLAKSDCLTARKPKTLPTNISAGPLPVLPHANDWVSKHFHGTLPAILGWPCITNQRIDHVKDCSTLRRSGFWIGQWGNPTSQTDMDKPSMTNTNSHAVKKVSATGMSSGGGSGMTDKGRANGTPSTTPKTTARPIGPASNTESPTK